MLTVGAMESAAIFGKFLLSQMYNLTTFNVTNSGKSRLNATPLVSFLETIQRLNKQAAKEKQYVFILYLNLHKHASVLFSLEQSNVLYTHAQIS